MSNFWYYADKNGQIGPVTFEELKASLATRQNTADVLVWHNGFEHWKRAADVPELAAPVLRPPPLPPRPPPLDSKPQRRALLSEAVSTPVASEKSPYKWRRTAKGFVSALVFLTALAIVRDITHVPSSKTPPPDPNSPISGTSRQSFVSEGMKFCMQKQENDPDTKALSISKDKLTNYCSCYMNTLADNVTVGDVLAMAKDGKYNAVPAFLQKKVDSASSVCMERFQKNLFGG